MSAQAIIRVVYQSGGKLFIRGDKLVAQNIPSRLLPDLKAHRDDVIAHLKNEAANDQVQPTPGLLATIKRMADFYQYADEDLAYALDDARQHPDQWRELVRNDRHATQFMDMPDHQLEVVAIKTTETFT